MEYIRLYAPSIHSVAEIAEHFGYNPEYMTTLIRRATGCSVIRHLNQAKIEEAKKHLLSSSRTISEIARRFGFRDPQYFSRLFHRETGVTPGEYRSTYGRIHLNRH